MMPAPAQNIGEDEENAGDFLDDDSANHIGHVSDGVTARMLHTELAQDEEGVGVEQAPGYYTQRTSNGSE